MALNIKKIDNRFTARKNHYVSYYQPKHKDIRDFIMPERGRFDDDDSVFNDGKDRFTELVDHTAGIAASRYAASLLDGLSPPTRDWFRMETKVKDLMEIQSVKRHFEEVNRKISQVLHDSNFYNSMADFYEEGVVFGTASVFVERDPLDLVRFTTFTMGEYYIDADSSARVNKWYREYRDTADNIVEKFGIENVSHKIKMALHKNGHQDFSIRHVIEPNKNADMTKIDNINMPVMSVYYEKVCSDDQPPLRLSGYMEMPVIVARLKTVGNEVYGQSPCNRVLGITKTLQEANKDLWRASKKTIDPPTNMPGKNKKKRIGAGSVNYFDGAQGAPQASAIYQINYDMQGNLLASSQIREAINKILNSDLFSAISGIDRRNMTATEIAQRVAEAIRMLVTVVTRMNSEALKPILERVYNLLDEAGELPEPPEELDGQEIDILFVSSLAQAQQAVGIAGVEQIIDLVTRIAQINPSILDKFDADQALDEVARMSGAPVQIVRSDEDVAAIRQRQAIRESQQRLADASVQMADSAQKLGNTPLNTGSALDGVMEGLQGA